MEAQVFIKNKADLNTALEGFFFLVHLKKMMIKSKHRAYVKLKKKKNTCQKITVQNYAIRILRFKVKYN